MSTIYPNLKLVSDFAECEDALSAINKNFKTLDNITQAGVAGVVATLPASPNEGDGVILAGTNQVNIYSNGAWTAYTPSAGWHFIDTTDCSLQVFDGTDWKKLPLPNDYTNFIINAANIGTGVPTFKQITNQVAEFRTNLAGLGMVIFESPDEVVFQSTGVLEAETIGTGEDIISGFTPLQKLELKGITGGDDITVTTVADDIVVSSDFVAGTNIQLDRTTTPGSTIISTDLTNNATNAVHVATGFQSFNGGSVIVQFTSDIEVSTALTLNAANDTFTVVDGGIYVINVGVEMFPSAATSSAVVTNVKLLVNGVERAGSVKVNEVDSFNGAVGTTHNMGISRTLSAGDTLQVQAVFNETPLDPSLNYSFVRTYFNGVKIA